MPGGPTAGLAAASPFGVWRTSVSVEEPEHAPPTPERLPPTPPQSELLGMPPQPSHRDRTLQVSGAAAQASAEHEAEVEDVKGELPATPSHAGSVGYDLLQQELDKCLSASLPRRHSEAALGALQAQLRDCREMTRSPSTALHSSSDACARRERGPCASCDSSGDDSSSAGSPPDGGSSGGTGGRRVHGGGSGDGGARGHSGGRRGGRPQSVDAHAEHLLPRLRGVMLERPQSAPPGSPVAVSVPLPHPTLSSCCSSPRAARAARWTTIEAPHFATPAPCHPSLVVCTLTSCQ